MSNDDENKRPSTTKNRTNNTESLSQKEKKSSNTTTRPVQYKILQRGQPDEATPSATKKSQIQTELNTPENSTTTSIKSQRNRRK
jgi:hypothetical protein